MTRSDARKRLAQCADIRATPEYADIRTLPAPDCPRAGLAAAFHARIDGDWLIGGGGWGPDGWVDDVPHDKARISDLVRWAVYAIEASDWLAAHDRRIRAQALREAADRMPAFHDRDVPEWAITSACRWLRESGDREDPR